LILRFRHVDIYLQASNDADVDFKQLIGIFRFTEDLQSIFDGKRKAHGAVKHADVYTYLRLVLARLYVLRNQLIHGSATWGGETNRAQVQDAAQILRSFVPIMIEIIMDDPDQEWGEPLYPVQY
jgi:hypothetical protein